jgi:hypothetical protein
MTYPYGELENKSDKELIAEHDRLADRTPPSLNYYLDELSRRSVARLAKWVLVLTVVLVVLTAVLVALTLVLIFRP